MPMPRRSSLFVLAALGLGLTAGACKDDPPTPKLFQEQGTWSVIRYDLDGAELREVDTMTRRDAFMLQFDAAEKVVTAAACIENEGDDVSSSLCLINPLDTRWDCRCFSYDFVREEQLWREFNPGDIPPEVSLANAEDEPDGGSGSGSAGGGGGGEDTLVNVSEVMDVNSTFNFRPLPEGVFGSDGVVSRFVMQKRADTLFEKVFEDPEGRAPCTPCI